MRYLALALTLAITPVWAQSPPKPLTVPLVPRAVALGSLVAGWGVTEAIPARAFAATVGSQTWLFLDLDGNGAIEVEKDGLALAGYPFVVRLTATMLGELGQHTWAAEGLKTLVLTPDAALDLPANLVREASDLSVMRIMAGLPLVRLDAEASRACRKHCDYLSANGLANGSGGMSAHDETEGRPGYSEDGYAAGRGGDLAFGQKSYRDALWSWYRTAWHGVPIVDPGLSAVGVAMEHGVGILYFVEKDSTVGAVDGSFLHPAPGATDVRKAFASEMPNPVPGTRYGAGSGFPITIQLEGDLRRARLVSATVAGPDGKPLAGTFSCPQNPANAEWPRNSGIALFIPKTPLSGTCRYTATFRFEGVDAPVVWTFTTGNR